MDAQQKAASDAIAQLTTEKADNEARIARLTARNAVIAAQLAALQPMAPAPETASQTAKPN
jgi:cell division protein FtsB